MNVSRATFAASRARDSGPSTTGVFEQLRGRWPFPYGERYRKAVASWQLRSWRVMQLPRRGLT